MKNLQFTDTFGTGYIQISMRKAEKAILKGINVFMCASNLRPFSEWHNEHEIIASTLTDEFTKEGDIIGAFRKTVMYFEHYNCGGTCGSYARFYIEKSYFDMI